MGPWKVSSNVFGGNHHYIVCRVRDEDKPVHSGNLIYSDRGYTDNQQEADAYAKQLNDLEASLPPCKECGRPARFVILNKDYFIVRCDGGYHCCSDVDADTLNEAVEKWRSKNGPQP